MEQLKERPEVEQLELTWENRIKLLLNGGFWSAILLVLGIACGLMTTLLLFISKSATALLVGAGVFGFILVLIVFVAALIDLFGGFRIRYALTTAGVRSIMGREAKLAADAAFWTGVLSGSLGAMGGGMLAKSEQKVFIAFQNVTEVKLRPRRRFIRVKGGFLQKPIALYCLPDIYQEAETILRRQCPTAKFV